MKENRLRVFAAIRPAGDTGKESAPACHPASSLVFHDWTDCQTFTTVYQSCTITHTHTHTHLYISIGIVPRDVGSIVSPDGLVVVSICTDKRDGQGE